MSTTNEKPVADLPITVENAIADIRKHSTYMENGGNRDYDEALFNRDKQGMADVLIKAVAGALSPSRNRLEHDLAVISGVDKVEISSLFKDEQDLKMRKAHQKEYQENEFGGIGFRRKALARAIEGTIERNYILPLNPDYHLA